MAIISEYVGLRAKSYSNNLYYPSNEQFKCKKKSKGVPSKHIDKRVDFDDYKTCLFDKVNIKLGHTLPFTTPTEWLFDVHAKKGKWG